MSTVHRPRRVPLRDARWQATPYRAIQIKIGQELKARYDAPQELPFRLLTLLTQMNEESGPAEETAQPKKAAKDAAAK